MFGICKFQVNGRCRNDSKSIKTIGFLPKSETNNNNSKPYKHPSTKALNNHHSNDHTPQISRHLLPANDPPLYKTDYAPTHDGAVMIPR